MYQEINKFPLTESSTLLLTELDYTFPLGLLLDANFYPQAENNPPFYISSIIKNAARVDLQVSDATGAVIFTIEFSLNQQGQGFCYGHGVQQGVYCGSCLFTKLAVDFFAALPAIPNISPSSLMFAASAIRPIPVALPTPVSTGRVYYNRKPVDNVVWGDNLSGGVINPTVVEVGTDADFPVNIISVNGELMKGRHLFITAGRQGVIRVSNNADITIGRLVDL